MRHIYQYDKYNLNESNIRYGELFDLFYKRLIAHLEPHKNKSVDSMFTSSYNQFPAIELRLSKIFPFNSKFTSSSFIMSRREESDIFENTDMDSMLSAMLSDLVVSIGFSKDKNKPRGRYTKFIGMFFRLDREESELDYVGSIGEVIDIMETIKPFIAHEFTHIVDDFRIAVKNQNWFGKSRTVDFMGYKNLKVMNRENYYNFTHEIHAYVNMILSKYNKINVNGISFTEFKDKFISDLDELAPQFQKYAKPDTMKRVYKNIADFYSKITAPSDEV